MGKVVDSFQLLPLSLIRRRFHQNNETLSVTKGQQSICQSQYKDQKSRRVEGTQLEPFQWQESERDQCDALRPCGAFRRHQISCETICFQRGSALKQASRPSWLRHRGRRASDCFPFPSSSSSHFCLRYSSGRSSSPLAAGRDGENERGSRSFQGFRY